MVNSAEQLCIELENLRSKSFGSYYFKVIEVLTDQSVLESLSAYVRDEPVHNLSYKFLVAFYVTLRDYFDFTKPLNFGSSRSLNRTQLRERIFQFLQRVPDPRKIIPTHISIAHAHHAFRESTASKFTDQTTH